MIPLSLIREFCSTDETRYILTQPREVSGMIVATDGRALIEVPTSETEPLTDEPLDGNYPNYKPFLEGPFSSPLGDPLPIPEIPPRPEPVKCDECGGSGVFECYVCHHSEKCECCEGVGSYIEFGKWVVEGAGFYVGGLYIERILRLPNVRLFAPVEPDSKSPVRFTFGQNGRGLLMQVRREGGWA